MLLKSPWQVRFTRFYFTIFRAKFVKDINFQVDFVAGNSNKLQKLGSEGNSVELSMCSHLGQRHRLTLVLLLISYGSPLRAWHSCKLPIPEGQYPWRCRELTTICTSNGDPC
jgi:hypothetical protein